MIGGPNTAFPDTVPHRAVIDIGSNTVRLVVYGGAHRAPGVLLNERIVARLGSDLRHSGAIPEPAIRLALDGLRRFRRILSDLHIDKVEVIATAAARVATNGQEFLERVRTCGFEPVLLSGEQEARASAMGVIGAFPGAKGMVADLGGGSFELVEVADGQSLRAASLPIGTLLLPGLRALGPDGFRRAIEGALDGESWTQASGGPLYMVGGTWRAMAGFAMQRRKHPLSDPHGHEIALGKARKLARRIALADPAALIAARIDPMRAAMLPDACALLEILLERLRPERLVFSSWGLREGWLYQLLDPLERTRDPLLSGVACFTAPRGGTPELAAMIAGWTVSALPRDGAGSERNRLAATMLAMAAIQVEPNLRLKQAISWALHKRWIDLGDEGRAMIAAALAASCGSVDLPRSLFRLTGEDRLKEAQCWGLGIRLARRLGGGSRASLRNSALLRENGRLVLCLGESHADLRADHVEADLAALAERLGLSPALEVVPNDSLRASS